MKLQYSAVGVLLVCLTNALAAPPKPVFYLPFEGTTTAALAGGSPRPVRHVAGQTDTILQLLAREHPRFVTGPVGQGYDIGDQPLAYECAGNFRADEGSAAFWVNPEWAGTNHQLYSTLFGAADWGMVYKYLNQSYLSFGTAKPTRDIYYDLGGSSVADWVPGQWHHVVVTWSRKDNQRRVYLDGKLTGHAPFPYFKTVTSGPLFVGAGCTLYPTPIAHAKMDEFALWDAPLDTAAVKEIYELGRAGKPLCAIPAGATTAAAAFPPAAPTAPVPSDANVPKLSQAGPRTVVDLNGWWAFAPAESEPGETSTQPWGLSRVPGYWTSPADTRGPDGKPLRGIWAGRPLAEFEVGCYQRRFTADLGWKSRHVRLQLGGVDGLAQVFCNGTPLGLLTSWEAAGYDLDRALRFGQENTVTIALYVRGGSKIAGVYGDVTLAVTPGPLVEDVAIRPHLTAGKLELSIDLWVPGKPENASLEFEVRAKSDPGTVVKRFTWTGRAAGRIDASFEWPDARLWCIDDPFLYDLTATLKVDGEVRDQAGPFRFGFREFEQRGGDFYLNGQPVHLRGHQLDFAWGNQLDHVKELRAAGLNALELSGPITSDWYRGIPYRRAEFEEVLAYCDEHGLIAAPNLPDPMVLRDRVFDPAVAKRYQHRVDSHVRAWGNHASIGLWYMDFNLAGYLWYCAPSKLDGSYQPDSPAFRDKERYAMEAERLAQQVDPRPIYHHACGNFGHQLTSNLYLGPNSPTQEREEWPSAWAAKRTKPFMAVEHCCWLICYWFRPRQFPLSVVYAGEPIFDELTALEEGPSAYQRITPELFDLYDMDRTPRGDRTRALIRHHSGYQAVKSEVARRSLRAWRTWGVPWIVFNAENWDFEDGAGHDLPVKQALAHYFGDTDLYVAGAPGDWPSKDHAFYAGEKVRKQVVLLNDLQHDIPVTLRWRVTDPAGKETAAGGMSAVSKAGVPTFVPVEFRAPAVAVRTELTLRVEPVDQPRHDFQPEAMALQVFPRPAPVAPGGVVLYDPAGDTAAMLRKAGVPFSPLAGNTELGSGAKLVIVGRRAWDAGFLAWAKAHDLESAIRAGLRLVVFAQTTAAPFGLKLTETSTRDSFVALSGDPLLAGLGAADLHDLRGSSDVIPPYPDAPPETEHKWPPRCFKWGNRGVLATYVYLKPHYAPFRAVLECGFDLTQSPLLEARYGRGTVTLCQVDVTERYGTDPVSTALVANLLRSPTTPATLQCSYVGEAAKVFLAPFGIAPEPYAAGAGGLVFVGAGEAAPEDAARAGATVVLLPGATAAGLRLTDQRWFIARLKSDPLLAGLNDGDLYLKSWKTTPAIAPEHGWRPLADPAVLAVEPVGQGRLVACEVDPERLGTRGRVKALRFWNVLLANLGADRKANPAFLTAPGKAFEPCEAEQIPPYMSW